MEPPRTGWERGRRVHFDEIAENYDRARWEYPPELYSDIFVYQKTGGRTALEIGAGTGKATAPVLAAGYSITAVELGANMAAFIGNKFNDNSNFNVIVSSFEDAVLPENNYDLIYAASAFHWVNAEVGCPRAFRFLRSGGTFALFRNNGVEGFEILEDFHELYEKYYLSFYPDNIAIPLRICNITAG